MIRKRSYKKRHSYKKGSKRKTTRHRYKYHSGGTVNIVYDLMNLINDNFKNKENTDKINEILDSITVSEMCNLKNQINKIRYDNYIIEYEKLQRNDIILTALLKKLPIELCIPHNINILETKYGNTLAISKIEPKLNDIKFDIDTDLDTYEKIITNHVIIFNGIEYTFKERGGFGSVFINEEQQEVIKIILENRHNDLSKEIINYNNISSLTCNTDFFCKFKSCFYTRISLHILMEYCGTNLKKIIMTEDVNISFELLIQWFITIAKGIKCMHDNNYVHFDIKPENIVIHENNAKLIDFGLAEYIEEGKKYLYKGTLGLMAPELMKKDNDESDYTKCDIYSLGVTFDECIFQRYFKHLPTNTTSILSLINLDNMTSDNSKDRPTIQKVIDILSTPDFKQSVFLKNIYHKSNFTELELKEAGFTASELINAGFKASKLKEAGFTLSEFKETGFTASNLIDAGFSLIDIFTLGKYPYGDIKKALPSKMTDDLKKQYVVLKDRVKEICEIDSIDIRGRHYDKECVDKEITKKK